METSVMKQILLLGSLFFSIAIIQPAKAQVNVQVNIGAQPQWGPIGYDYVDYYYLPDIEAYYYVPTRQFIYMEGDRWIFAANLPYHCRNYDLYSGYKVVINGRDPYRNHFDYRRRYAPNCYRGSQIIIRDRGYGYGRYRDNYQYRDERFENDRRRSDYRYDDERGRDDDKYKHKHKNKDRHGRGNRRHGW